MLGVFSPSSHGLWAAPGDLGVQGGRVRQTFWCAGHCWWWHSDCGPRGESSFSRGIDRWGLETTEVMMHRVLNQDVQRPMHDKSQYWGDLISLPFPPASHFSYDGLFASGNHWGSWRVFLLGRCAAEKVPWHGFSGRHGEEHQQPETLL